MNLVPCSVLSNREVTEGNFLLTLQVPRGFARPQPGQFVHLRITQDVEPLLRRPYSLEGFVEQAGLDPVHAQRSIKMHSTRLKQVDTVRAPCRSGHGRIPSIFTAYRTVHAGCASRSPFRPPMLLFRRQDTVTDRT